MEQKNQELQLSKNSEPTALSRIIQAEKGISVADATEEEIKQVLRYIFVLLGLQADKIPQEEDKALLIMFIKNNLSGLKVEEIRVAFDLAFTGAFEVDIKTYGEPFNLKYLNLILNAYKQFRVAEKKAAMFKKRLADQKLGMNNEQRVGAIIPHLSEETRELIQRIGSQQEKLKEIRKHPYYDIHQRWFRQFDDLLKKWRHEYDFEGKKINGKFIKRYGKIMDVEMYFNKKVEQLALAKERKSNLTL